MQKTFCTIITNSHLHFALALHESIVRFVDDVDFHVLIVDSFDFEGQNIPVNFHIYRVNDLTETPVSQKIYDKYYGKGKGLDTFRWSMKAVFMNHLLSGNSDSVIYLDADLFFFSDPTCFFDLLKHYNVLLSPVFRCSDPDLDYKDFFRHSLHGLYCAGFVGANRNGMAAMQWWADTCSKVCKKDLKIGSYDDQSHLNLMPVLFEKVHIMLHRGCNVASWNLISNPRSIVDNKLILNGTHELIFVHFARDTIKGILNGNDPLLMPHLQEYNDALKRFKPNFDLIEKFKKKRSLLNKLFS